MHAFCRNRWILDLCINTSADGDEVTEERLDGWVDDASSSHARQSSAVEAGWLPASYRQRGFVGARQKHGAACDVAADDRRRDAQSAELAAYLVERVHQRQGADGRGHLARCLSADVLRLQRHLLAVVYDVNCLGAASVLRRQEDSPAGFFRRHCETR